MFGVGYVLDEIGMSYILVVAYEVCQGFLLEDIEDKFLIGLGLQVVVFEFDKEDAFEEA